MVERKVRDEAEAVAIVEEARRRGVRPSVVGRERGISGRSVQAWSMTLAKKQAGEVRPESTFLELVPVALTTPRSYRLWVEDLSVEVPDDFDEHTVRRLVAALRTC